MSLRGESKLDLDLDTNGEALDDDPRTITLSSMESDQPGKHPSSPLLKGMDLDLSYTRDRKGFDNDEEYRRRGVQEEEVMVIFELPDGSQGEMQFKLGQTVEVLKSYVESEYGIPMHQQTLFIEEKPMLNPLSLLDYPEAKGVDEIYIRVEGPLPSESKK